MRLLRRMILSGLAAIALSSPALAEPALWKVSDADSEIYLFGSVHIFTRDMDWRTPEFDALLKSAEHVYFEVVLDVEAYSTITQISLTQGMFGNGETLADLLSSADYERVMAAAAQAGANARTLDRMRPWLAAMTLMNGVTPKATAGVETLVDGEIEPERKRSLKTAAEQMGFFTDAPLDEQIDSLMATVEGIESGAITTLEPLMDAWESGDTVALLTAMNAQITSRDRALYDRLIDDRNARWVAPLEALLADNDESLVIVGAAHLVGPNGVPALLEQRGYTVERVDDPPPGGPLAAETQLRTRRR